MDLSASAKVFCYSFVILVQESAAVAVTVEENTMQLLGSLPGKIKQNKSGHFSDEAYQHISSSVQLTQGGETCVQKKAIFLTGCGGHSSTALLLHHTAE